jgi:hypothetical protein
MVSIPVLAIFLAVVVIYLTGCLVYHIRDIREKRAAEKDSGQESAARRDDAHEIHL